MASGTGDNLEVVRLPVLADAIVALQGPYDRGPLLSAE
jgi:hypothetical protein